MTLRNAISRVQRIVPLRRIEIFVNAVFYGCNKQDFLPRAREIKEGYRATYIRELRATLLCRICGSSRLLNPGEIVWLARKWWAELAAAQAHTRIAVGFGDGSSWRNLCLKKRFVKVDRVHQRSALHLEGAC